MAFQQGLALPFQLACHLVEQPPQHGDFIIALFFRNLHVKIAPAHALRGPRKPADRPRQTFGKPQAQPNRRKNENDRKTKIQQSEFEQQPPAFGFQLMVQPHGFPRFIQQPQKRTVDRPGHLQKPVGECIQPDQGAEFVVLPVFDDDGFAQIGRRNLLGIGRFEVKKVGIIPACLDETVSVDHEGFTQAALDLGLDIGQDHPQVAVADHVVGLPLQVQKGRKLISILGQIALMFIPVRLCRLQG